MKTKLDMADVVDLTAFKRRLMSQQLRALLAQAYGVDSSHIVTCEWVGDAWIAWMVGVAGPWDVRECGVYGWTGERFEFRGTPTDGVFVSFGDR